VVTVIVILAQGSRFTIRHLNLIKTDLSPPFFYLYSEYKKRYKEDPRLPSCPDEFHKNGWIVLYDFIRERKKIK